MNNFPAERHQADGLQHFYSQLTALDFYGANDTARQEFAADADLNTILKRHGAAAVTNSARPEYGQVDFDLDLQTALSAIDTARRMMPKLPASLREKYPDWRSLLNAIESGELRLDMSKQPDSSIQEPRTDPVTV